MRRRKVDSRSRVQSFEQAILEREAQVSASTLPGFEELQQAISSQ